MSNRILSYRGLLADGGQDTILLSTKKGEIGYRIIKMQVMHAEPGQQSAEHTIKVYSVSQTVINNAVDFSDTNLLAAAHIADHADVAYALDTIVVFDQMIFNQDIYITHEDTRGSEHCNYYLELEVIKLDESQAMVATLSDIRSNS